MKVTVQYQANKMKGFVIIYVIAVVYIVTDCCYAFTTIATTSRTTRSTTPSSSLDTISAVPFGIIPSQHCHQRQRITTASVSALTDATIPATDTATNDSSDDDNDSNNNNNNNNNIDSEMIPTNLPSDCGMDYIPLATMLATGQLLQADQFTRDALIEISGAKAKGRNFVYFTDVKNIPSTDLGTIERLWNQFSDNKFGYSIQRKKWKQSNSNFEVFCKKVGWTTTDGDVERKKRWFGASEFIYDVKKAPEGHLPLTSALRGTSLLKQLLNHPVWENEQWKESP